jgi:drug/metabolite transporter (DMT)-like permease
MATKRPMGHFIRASFGAMALFASFASLTRLNVAEVMLMAQLSPILMAIAAVALLRERLTLWRVAGLFLDLQALLLWFGPNCM